MAGDRLPRKLVDARKLASLLRGGPGGPLVIDSRSFVEYSHWHVLSSVNICCSKLTKRRLQQGKVTIAELIQPAVHSQVPGAGHPCSLPPARRRPGSLAPGPRLSRVPRAHTLSSLPTSALEPKPGSSGSECSEPVHTPGLVGQLPAPPLLQELPPQGGPR